LLERELGGETTLGFVMLNPSTADAEIDDPTIRRCIGFARRWGYGRLAVANLFPLRAANPKALATEAIDADADAQNVFYLGTLAHQANRLVVAWGANRLAAAEIKTLFRLGVLTDRSLYCLGTTASGAPRHPLYVRGSTTPILWRAAR
jgi:hypothetical protein